MNLRLVMRGFTDRTELLGGVRSIKSDGIFLICTYVDERPASIYQMLFIAELLLDEDAAWPL